MGATRQHRRLRLARYRNFAPATMTTILAFLVTLGWLFLPGLPGWGTDRKASAFALGYYLERCTTFQGQRVANRFSNEAVRLASRLRIPTEVFPGQRDQRKPDTCYDSAIALQVAHELTITIEGYFLLGMETAMYESLSPERSPSEILERLHVESKMHDIIGKIGSAEKSKAVSSFCDGHLNADQLYSRLFGAKDHLLRATSDSEQKGVR
jgi:hypothetical protein